MNRKFTFNTLALVAFALLAIVVGSAAANAEKSYAGAGVATTGDGYSSQFVSTGGTGTGGSQTFSLGSGFMYSMTSVSPQDMAGLESSGVKVVRVPAGTNVYVTATTGQPPSISTGTGPTNMIVFGPGGFVGAGAWTGTGSMGPGVGVGVQVPGAGAGAIAGGGAGAGAGTTIGGTGGGVVAGPGGTTQMYSFSGQQGQAYLITQQSGGQMDRVLVVFE